MKRITIIGGGASGTLTAVGLLRHAASPIKIDLIELDSRRTKGVAYGTSEDVHLLNVPAAKMGAFPDDIEHFHRWLTDNGYNYSGSDFVPRRTYGKYLNAVLDDAVASRSDDSEINFINDEAISVEPLDNGAAVTTASGRKIETDAVVIAFGNALPPHPNVPDNGYTAADKYFRDPWNSRVYTTITADDDILVIGTGLSMVDVAMRYYHSGHRGKLYALSTHGLLPAVHELGHTYPNFETELSGVTRVTEMLRIIRRHAKNADTSGSNWRAVIDSLRPATQLLWLGLSTSEKLIFKRRLARYWNTARHRMPAEAAAVLDEMSANGKLEILGGKLRSIELRDGRFDVEYLWKGSTGSFTADAVINCIGSESDLSRLESDLVKQLLSSGQIRADELRMGFDATPDGTLIDADGKPSRHLRTLSTALKGILWESTAMPEIRGQADALALRLLAE